MTVRILITGSRHWPTNNYDPSTVLSLLYHAYNSDITIIHGACPYGVDVQADQWARTNNVNVERYHAQWSKYGAGAGPRRNREMVETSPDLCLAFICNNSRGAVGCSELAIAAEIPTYRFMRNEDYGYPILPH